MLKREIVFSLKIFSHFSLLVILSRFLYGRFLKITN